MAMMAMLIDRGPLPIDITGGARTGDGQKGNRNAV